MNGKSAIALFFLSFAMGLPVRLVGQASSSSSGNTLEGMPKDLEVRLALSALPPYLRSDATVYVLDPTKGYVLERQGKNDFTCFVERTDWVRADYRNDLLIPECFDAEGTKTIVPVSLAARGDDSRDVPQGRSDRRAVRKTLAKRPSPLKVPSTLLVSLVSVLGGN